MEVAAPQKLVGDVTDYDVHICSFYGLRVPYRFNNKDCLKVSHKTSNLVEVKTVKVCAM